MCNKVSIPAVEAAVVTEVVGGNVDADKVVEDSPDICVVLEAMFFSKSDMKVKSQRMTKMMMTGVYILPKN